MNCELKLLSSGRQYKTGSLTLEQTRQQEINTRHKTDVYCC